MRNLLLAAAVLLPIAPAYGEPCAEFSDRKGFAELSVAQVKTGAARVPFVKDDCTVTKANTCQSKAYVMPGDIVLVGAVFDTLACAAFVNAKGQATTGLLPTASLQAPVPRPRKNATALVGTWTRTEAKIVVKPRGADGTLSFEGNATYGALDKGRVARGAVNLGEFSFDLKPQGNIADVAIKDGLPVAHDAKGVDDTDCAVAMIAVGPYLVVKDNLGCGGANVSFTGVYRRGQ